MKRPLLFCLAAIVGLATAASGSELAKVQDEILQPFSGTSVSGVNTQTLKHKVMCGYQGWFNSESDGAGRGWEHWTLDGRRPSAANIRVDMWPDVSELPPEERDVTDLKHSD